MRISCWEARGRKVKKCRKADLEAAQEDKGVQTGEPKKKVSFEEVPLIKLSEDERSELRRRRRRWDLFKKDLREVW